MIFFDKIVKRVANFSVQSYEKNKKDKIQFFNDDALFKLSILISSRSLYEDANKNKNEKIKKSLSKYFSRAHFNPTPFGIFSSVGVVKWGDSTLIKKNKDLKLNVRYDNSLLSSKVNAAMDKDWLTKFYCINPSIYFRNETKISFFKSEIQDIGKIELKHVEIDFDENLEWLIERFEKKVHLSEIVEELVLNGFERIDVEEYLQNVLESGLIVEYFLFFPYAEKLSNDNSMFFSALVDKKTHLIKSNYDVESFSDQYISDQKVFFEENKEFKYSHLINSFDTDEGVLDQNFQDKIKRFIDFTINFNTHSSHKNITLGKFISKISQSYNDGFIPLTKIFNPYSGLSYKSFEDVHNLKLDKEIVSKILTSDKEDVYLDLFISGDNNETKKSKLPATFSILVEVLTCKDSSDPILYIKNLGANSALNLISRFSDITNDICQDIVTFEKQIHENKLVADINCIGTFRSLNISPVKQFYDYCIPINTTFTNNSNPILLSDIYVHLEDGRIALVSKKYKKEVIPKLTSAINPNLSDSEFYSFLCDYEFYNQEIYGVNFDFNSYNYAMPYVPRIYLEKGVLLFPSQILLVNNNYSFVAFQVYLAEKIKEYSFSKIINFSDIKGEITIDTDIVDDIFLIYEKIKERNYLYVSESLYESFNPQIIDKEHNNFSHELVVSVKNGHYTRPQFNYDNVDEILSENIPVLSDWLYLEIFGNSYSNHDILKFINEAILLQGKTDLFFFVNYANPDRHLRVRFKTNSRENKEYIILKIHELKSNHLISKYHILPYEQEIHRYGGIQLMELAESIFSFDSMDFINNVINLDLDEDSVKITAMLKIKNYFNYFGLSLEEMIENCERAIKLFSKEFELTAKLRKSLNKDFLEIRNKIDHVKYVNFLDDLMLGADIVKKLNENKFSLYNYMSLIIHMSMNRHFSEEQRFNELKVYYLAKTYLNQLKFKK
ncbi:lantibiotic dehydratase [Flavobacterium collinsii]|uniref:Nisin biosynthesis protein NisB n=1 Tax=Flavobacterium collinsii TaxID=1114861 RepID=A0A9W4TKU6_9FLAO|nr:lantibiotic dehydratase [Flavobacterium collinsii]CAI2768649.1 conserved protein of unknown function [Flavobacterium collinsii]